MTRPTAASIGVCPCCEARDAQMAEAPFEHAWCQRCGHNWRLQARTLDYYRALVGRSPDDPVGLTRKHDERFAFLRQDLLYARKILEIGCAEGLFGAFVKERASHLQYDGLEVSRDAEAAARVLNKVYQDPIETVTTPDRYDLVLLFHVLEHIQNAHDFLLRLMPLLAVNGQLIVEVPLEAGNRLVPWDRNPEHLHFFTTTSICALLQRCGLRPVLLITGGFESPLYNDTIRLKVRKSRLRKERDAAFRAFLARRLAPRCVIFGLGGDFRNWLQPYLDDHLVAAYIDSNPGCALAPCEGRQAEGPEVLAHYRREVVVIATYRFQEEIRVSLMRDHGVEPHRILTLPDLIAAAESVAGNDQL